jgi:hypothetical protein
MVITRRNLLMLFAADVVIFVLSNVVSETNAHPGTASNVLWVIFLIGALALIVGGIAAAIRSARSRRAGA